MRIKLILGLFLSALVYPSALFAFCGFYVGGGGKDLFNDATMVVMMRHENQTVLSMQNDYDGPPEDFAMVIPVPQVLEKSNVKALDNKVFDHIDRLAAPRLVQYWEQDPCMYSGNYGRIQGLGSVARGSGGMSMGALGSGSARPKVRVKAKFDVKEYEIVILDADDSSSLEAWLTENKYKIPKGAKKHFQPYIEAGQYFFVAKVDVTKLSLAGGKTRLSPLRFSYQSEDFTLPIRLGLINNRGKQDLIVHILADSRYEAANYENVAVPTNLEVKKKVLKDFGSFYASLFDRVMKNNPGAVVTEYAWTPQKCDPCPGGVTGNGPLSRGELMKLGGDVITGNGRWVLTRLHTRYTKNAVGEDLVFKKAEPLVGGRESDWRYAKVNGAINQFQGRYIVRHRWAGPIACKNPKRGIWTGRGKPAVAKDTAYAKNRSSKLKTVIKGKLPYMGTSL